MADGLGETRPTRWKVLLLALITPLGVAHYYAGQRRRAFVWVTAMYLALLITATLLLTLGPAAVWPLCIALVVLACGVWLFPIADLLTIAPARYEPVPIRSVMLAGVAFLLASVSIRTGIRFFALEAFSIPSGAMMPTLWPGDRIYVDKRAYGPVLPFGGGRVAQRLPPARGDAIVFEYPYSKPSDDPMDFVKRVVAVEGDTLEVEGGHPIINGWRVPSCHVGAYAIDEAGTGKRHGELHVEFLGERPYLIWLEDMTLGSLRQGPYVVPTGEVWVLGDNRHSSSDSRAWLGGKGAGVPYDKIKGRLLVVWLAMDESEQIRFDRLGTNFLDGPRLPADVPAELARGLDRCLASRPAMVRPPAAGGK